MRKAVAVPRGLPGLTTDRVLTMTFLEARISTITYTDCSKEAVQCIH